MKLLLTKLALMAVALFVPVRQLQAEEPQATISTPAVMAELDRRFESILGHLTSANYGAAAEELAQLREFQNEKRLGDLSLHARELLARAKRLQAEDSRQLEIGFIVRQALLLVPSDWQAHLEALSFSNSLTWLELVQLVQKAVQAFSSDPVLLIVLVLNSILLTLSALTVVVFVIGFFRIVVEYRLLVAHLMLRFSPFPNSKLELEKRISWITFTLLLIPILLGLLFASVAWFVAVSTINRRYRGFLALSGVIALLWGMTLPLGTRVREIVADPKIEAVQRVISGSYPASYKKRLESGVAVSRRDPVISFALAEAIASYGDSEQAQALFATVLSDDSASAELQKAALIGSGAAYYQVGNFSRAREVLSQMEELAVEGEVLPFEYYYNMAQVQMRLRDTAKYREYYSKALQIDPLRTIESNSNQTNDSAVLRARLSYGFMISWIFSRLDFLSTEAPADTGDIEVNEGGAISMLVRTLVPSESPFVLVLIGFAALVVLLFPSVRQRNRIVMDENRDLSWSPRVIVDRLSSTVLALVVLTALIFLAVGKPLVLLPVSKYPIVSGQSLLLVAIVAVAGYVALFRREWSAKDPGGVHD